ncbi:MAG: hypothetical protein IT464_11625 [Planctomycetes bacterium]|nr:hypothetical protein [Planctomycetota bacterium]
MRKLAVALLLLLPLSATHSAEELTEASYDRIVKHIMPSAEEEAWRKLAWRTTFWQGVMDANKEDKPVMLYTMNGHPFGCT